MDIDKIEHLITLPPVTEEEFLVRSLVTDPWDEEEYWTDAGHPQEDTWCAKQSFEGCNLVADYQRVIRSAVFRRVIVTTDEMIEEIK